MKAILNEYSVITIYPETISEMIVLQVINENPVDDHVVLSEEIYEKGDEE